MNKYKFHWQGGRIDDGAGDSPADALSRLGYGQGALAALDYYETFGELPKVPKPEDTIRNLRTHLGGLAICVLQQDWEGAKEMANQVEVTCKDGIKARLPMEK